jgi:hypothetical protein
MNIDCLYSLFVTHLGFSLFKPTYDNYFQLDCGRLKSLLFYMLQMLGLNSSVEYFQ